MIRDCNSIPGELNAYDNIGVSYYYLGELEKAMFYHERMMRGKIESKSSNVRKSSDKYKIQRELEEKAHKLSSTGMPAVHIEGVPTTTQKKTRTEILKNFQHLVTKKLVESYDDLDEPKKPTIITSQKQKAHNFKKQTDEVIERFESVKNEAISGNKAFTKAQVHKFFTESKSPILIKKLQKNQSQGSCVSITSTASTLSHSRKMSQSQIQTYEKPKSKSSTKEITFRKRIPKIELSLKGEYSHSPPPTPDALPKTNTNIHNTHTNAINPLFNQIGNYTTSNLNSKYVNIANLTNLSAKLPASNLPGQNVYRNFKTAQKSTSNNAALQNQQQFPLAKNCVVNIHGSESGNIADIMQNPPPNNNLISDIIRNKKNAIANYSQKRLEGKTLPLVIFKNGRNLCDLSFTDLPSPRGLNNPDNVLILPHYNESQLNAMTSKRKESAYNMRRIPHIMDYIRKKEKVIF